MGNQLFRATSSFLQASLQNLLLFASFGKQGKRGKSKGCLDRPGRYYQERVSYRFVFLKQPLCPARGADAPVWAGGGTWVCSKLNWPSLSLAARFSLLPGFTDNLQPGVRSCLISGSAGAVPRGFGQC